MLIVSDAWKLDCGDLAQASCLQRMNSPIPDPAGERASQPSISVLIRSMARASLSRALDSVAAQTVDGLEVIVVNAAGITHPSLPAQCGRFPMRLVEPNRPLPRSAAANAALTAATSRYALFLDDDDSIEPEHLDRLHTTLQREPRAVAAYAGVRKLSGKGEVVGTLDVPWDHASLFCENFLPIHAVLFDRSRLDTSTRFDPQFTVYEDWDFWLQLAQQSHFVHVPGVSASYHLIGESSLSTDLDGLVSADGRRAIYLKWAARIPADLLQRIATRTAVLTSKLPVIEAHVSDLEQSRERAFNDLNARAGELDAARLQHQQALQSWSTTQSRLLDLQQDLSAAQQRLMAAQRRQQDTELRLAALIKQADAQEREHRYLQQELEDAKSALPLLEQHRERLSLFEREFQQATERALRTTAHAAELEARAHQLEHELAAARGAYATLESGYGQVTSSLSWRVSQPLRKVRSAVGNTDGLISMARKAVRVTARAIPVSARTKQQLKIWMVSRPRAARWLPWLALSPSIAPLAPATAAARCATQVAALNASARQRAAGNESKHDKEAARLHAEQQLDNFLAGIGRISLPDSSTTPVVSVIVVLFNQAGLSRLCLDSLAATHGVDFETLIVDNASTDRMPQLLARVDGAKLIPQIENLGFLRAVNLAAAKARGEYLLLLNNDALVEQETVSRAVDRLNKEPDAGAVGGPILLWDGRLQEAGSIVWRDGSCLGYGRGEDPNAPPFRFVRDVDYCSGAFLMTRRKLFRELGGFDEVFAPAYFEESDYCARLWEKGHRVVYDPAARVHHFEFASDEGSGRAIELQIRNRQHFVDRHPAFLAERPTPAAAHILRARQRLSATGQRILVVDDRVPLAWLGQGYPRAASMVCEIAAAGHAVTHYPLQFPHESCEDIARALPETVEVITDRGLAGFADFLSERAGHYDVVMVSRPHNMEVLQAVLRDHDDWLRGARVIFDAEALFSLREISKAALLGAALPQAEQEQRIRAELTLADRADAVVTVSEREARQYRQHCPGRPVHVIGHSLLPMPGKTTFAERSGFLFVGAMLEDDTPNSDSLVWFIGHVWPKIQAGLDAQAELHVVGPCRAPAVLALAAPGLVLHGASESLRPHMDAARVFIVPTRYAAGIPYKAHEAAAHGLPLVTTRLIAEQLNWEDVIPNSDDANAFAQACIALHDDEVRWQYVRQEVLDAVERDCAPVQVRAVVRRVVEGKDPSQEYMWPTSPLHRRRLQALIRWLRNQHAISAGSAAQRSASQTADHWGNDAKQRLNELNALRHWSSHPTLAPEINRMVSDDPQTGWIGYLKRRHFTKAALRGLSLGCGGGAAVCECVALDIVEHMEGIDISPAAIALAQQRAEEAGLVGRARFSVADLNAPRLQGPYDLIMFEQSLHHIEALDHVLDACVEALAPEGLFVINEYVGPDRFQWSDDVQHRMDQLLKTLPPRYRAELHDRSVRECVTRLTPEAVIAVDQSEAIHSSRILPACAVRFELVERRDFGGTLLQFMLAEIAANFDPDSAEDRARLLGLWKTEQALIREGAIESCFVFAIYRARRK